MIPLFDWCTFVLASGSSIPAWGEVLLIATSTGVVGMGLSDIASGLSERISGGDDAGGELGGDEDFAGDGFGDDEFGDFDDWDDDSEEELDDWSGDDGLDDLGGGGGGGHSDLEPRLDELENEVATISSTMGTVRSENEAINETVEDIEDNIRKLLDIYEMVTRGVNPFVDEAQASGGMGDSFGLFDDADNDGGFDELDPDVADADPDSFFDDDFDGGEFDEDDFDDEDFDDADEGFDDVEDGFDDDVPSGSTDDPDAAAGASTAPGAGADDGGEGKTFDELKSEYEAGAADWDPEDGSVDGDGDAPAGREQETVAEEPAPPEGVEAAPDASALDSVQESGDRVDGSDGAEDPPAESSEAVEETESEDGTDGGSDRQSRASDGKPYLEALPSGYGAELLVIEWLSYLRGRSSTSEALRAINYYQNIGWIGSPAARSLQEYLSGLAEEEVTPTSTGATQLTIDHHTNSLRYIGKLGGKHVDVERLEWSGSGRDGGRMERRGQRGIQR